METLECVDPKAAAKHKRQRRFYDMHVVEQRARKRAAYRKKVIRPISGLKPENP